MPRMSRMQREIAEAVAREREAVGNLIEVATRLGVRPEDVGLVKGVDGTFHITRNALGVVAGLTGLFA